MRPVPARMAHLPRDPRGYPVFWIALVDTDGRAHFTVNDWRKVERCHSEGRCSICGKGLGSNIWFVGGPLSAFHPDGAYNDPPMHKDCALFALSVCPYLSRERWGHAISGATVDPAKVPGVLMDDVTMREGRPHLFVLAKARSVETRLSPSAHGIPHVRCRPRGAWLAVEYWRHGQPLGEAEAMPLIEQTFAEYVAEQQQ